MHIHCYAFGSPCILSPELAMAPLTNKLITTIVLGDDVVPQLSFESMNRLKTVCLYSLLFLSLARTFLLSQIPALLHFLFFQKEAIVESKTLGHPENNGIVALSSAVMQNPLRCPDPGILIFTVLGIPESAQLFWKLRIAFRYFGGCPSVLLSITYNF